MFDLESVIVGLVTGAVSSYFVTTFIQWKTDKKVHCVAKNKLSSYLKRVFDEVAIIQQKQELQEEQNDATTDVFNFGTLIHLLSLSPEYIAIDHVTAEGQKLLDKISEFLDEIYELCFEHNLCNGLKTETIIVLNDIQNKAVTYSKEVLGIAYRKKWWIAF